MKQVLLLSIALACSGAFAQTLTTAQLQAITQKHVRASFSELDALLSIPNNAHIDGQMQPNIDWLRRAFEQRGFQVSTLSTPTNPLVLAEKKAPATRTASPAGIPKTLLLYMHFDGQPVVPSQWQQADPYRPVLKELGEDGSWAPMDWSKLQTNYNPDWRIFGRSSSDDKGPIAMLLAALTALEKEKIPQRYNLKVILDSEEEIGSPHLASTVLANKEKLAADLLLVMDGGRHLSNLPTLIYGCRGITTVTLTTFGPRGPQHSGHYGNYAPNPALRLVQLLAGMKDEDGRVTIPGYYDGITIDEKAAKLLAAVPDDPAQIAKTVGIAAPDRVGRNYQEALQYPSLNIRGLQSAYVGKQAGTVIPDRAIAELDLRLVPETDPARLVSLIRTYIEGKGFRVLDHEPTEAERMQYPKLIQLKASGEMLPFRTEIGIPEDVWLTRAMVRAFGREPVKIRMTGGSVPIVPFLRTLNIPAIHVPMVNLDNNQHAANENLRVGNYVEGITTWLAILTN
ncbi:M20/M25/M40 family metallo-hydrolase [Spirosoma sordidisoli]|uniref:M20/M25/M40 family metallo-hydrolase n=1 Tax=Spirosoma sordidisoli TaxID=2502893 RepID=A0A4Q2UHI1_9BACT|nr:M20/M25/M40 family metallo-hydrolase [Spirosoma sordidisoli]RYC66925.1 M20/M25/M40 family metallo-hydrolase [Spirosoma sordidisoli]